MSNICSLVGVPNIFIISTSWSTALSPGKRGLPKIISAMTQPALQTSIAGE